jgi:hypothetical protein
VTDGYSTAKPIPEDSMTEDGYSLSRPLDELPIEPIYATADDVITPGNAESSPIPSNPEGTPPKDIYAI